MYNTLVGIIATSRICFYFVSCRKTIPNDVKLYLNENVLSKTEIYKTQFFVAASNLLDKLAFFSILLHGSYNICDSPAKYTAQTCLYSI